MGKALELAQSSAEAGEVPVGALLLDASGVLVSEGENRTLRDGDPTAHAEIVALRREHRP